MVGQTGGASRALPPEAGPDFARQVRDALGHLYDPVYLQRHPLARTLTQELATGDGHGQSKSGVEPGSAVEQAARALRRRLEEAIAALEPGSDWRTGDRAEAWRGARLLQLRYVQALPPEAVQRELGISRAQFYRDQARALDALVSLLAHQWPQPARPQSPEPTAAPAATASTDGALPEASIAAQASPVPQPPWSGPVAVRPAGVADSEGSPVQLPAWPALVMMTIAWGGAWFAVWSFEQTTIWPVAWMAGGAIGGLAAATVLRLAAPALSWQQVRRVALAWTAAWPSAWLIGWLAAGFISQVLPPEALAGADPNNPGYAFGKVAGWAGGGLVMGSVIRRAGVSAGRASPVAAALGWAAAGVVGHAVFWALDPALDRPSIRFALSGLIEGAIGASVTLWQLGRLWPPARLSRGSAAAPVPRP